ncbi:MAG: T9SS type B sorting domain-containing protein, partial [Sphingobacteriales bacterium]
NPAIPNPLAWPSATTTYYLASAGFGCTYNDTILVNVNAYPVVQMPADTAFCLGGSAILQPQVNQPYSYLWSPSTGLSDTTIRNPVASPSATTLYTLTTTLGGCPDTSYVTVTVKALPPADAGPDAALCPNKQVVLAAVPSSGSSYFWSPAAGLSSVTDSVVTASPSVTTTYYLAVTGANGCRAVDSVMVTAFVQPQLAATPEFPEGIAPYPLTFTNQSTGGTTYSWNFNNGTGSTELNPAANFPEPGVYEIVLTTSYGSGCLYSDTVARVTVVPPYVPNIITPNGDGVNDVFVAKVSNLPLHLQIFNRWGNLLFETDNYQHNWGGSDLPHGVYYYHLSTPDGGNWKGWL